MTFLCYIDEAGCTTPLPAAATDIQPVLVIVGMMVDATKVRELTLEFLKLKRQYFPRRFGNSDHPLDDVLIEIKGSDLRSTGRLLDLPTFGHSNNHVPLQIADMLCSTLLFPMATSTYCHGHISGKHVRGRDKFIRRRYASRIKALQYRYKDAGTGQSQGGVFVSDGLHGRRSDLIFQFHT